MLQVSNSTQNYSPSFGRVILSHSAERVLKRGDSFIIQELKGIDALLKESESTQNYKPVDVFIDYINPIKSFISMFKRYTGEFNVYLGKTAEAPLFFSMPERIFNDPLIDVVKNAIENIKK